MLTISIIALTAIVSIVAFRDQSVFEKLCFFPYHMNNTKGEYFRFVSVGFVHADPGHLLFNMITLYFFGSQIEQHILSETQYLLFYVSAIVLSAGAEFTNQKENPNYRACGAVAAYRQCCSRWCFLSHGVSFT